MLFHWKCRGNEVVVPFFSHSGQTFWGSHLLAEKGEKSLSQNWKLYFCSVFTGQVLTYDNIREVIKFCAREKLVLFADEVYQETVFTDEVQFHSCRKVLRDLGPEYNKFQLMSINSVSKGFYGEYVHNLWDNSFKPINKGAVKKNSFEGLSQQPGRIRKPSFWLIVRADPGRFWLRDVQLVHINHVHLSSPLNVGSIS